MAVGPSQAVVTLRILAGYTAGNSSGPLADAPRASSHRYARPLLVFAGLVGTLGAALLGVAGRPCGNP